MAFYLGDDTLSKRIFIDKKSFSAGASTITLLLAIIFRLIGGIQLLDDKNMLFLHCLLPAATILLFILTIAVFGRKVFWISFIPVLIGVAYYIFTSLDQDSKIQILLSIVLAVLVAVVYCCTVFGTIRTRLLLVVVFLLPIVFRIAIQDWEVIIGAKLASFSEIMMEISLISTLIGMMFAALGLKKMEKAKVIKSKDISLPVPGGVQIKSEQPKEEKSTEEKTSDEKSDKKS